MMTLTLPLLATIVFYLSVFFGLFLLPDWIWDQIMTSYVKLITLIKKRKKSLSLFGLGEIYRGNDLIVGLAECEARLFLGIKILPETLPQYKFYTDLLEQLFLSHRTLGIGIKKFIPDIRLAITRDLSFEKKIGDEICSGVLQFLVIAATTWSFVFLSKSLVQIPLERLTTFLMIALESFGALLFFYLVNRLKTKTFSPFAKSFEELYLFSSLMDVGLPINEVQERSRIMEGSLCGHKHFTPLADRLKKLIARMKETGLSPKDEAQEIIRELWHLQEVYFGRFTKMVQILKFSILAFFFLPAYFLYLHSIFKFFMEQ